MTPSEAGSPKKGASRNQTMEKGGAPAGRCGGVTGFFKSRAIELAAAVTIGTTFAALVNALVVDWVTPLIAALLDKRNFAALSFTIGESVFRYGHFITELLVFVFACVLLLLLVWLPMRKCLQARAKRSRECPECTSEIPAKATRCKYCCAIIGGNAIPLTAIAIGSATVPGTSNPLYGKGGVAAAAAAGAGAGAAARTGAAAAGAAAAAERTGTPTAAAAAAADGSGDDGSDGSGSVCSESIDVVAPAGVAIDIEGLGVIAGAAGGQPDSPSPRRPAGPSRAVPTPREEDDGGACEVQPQGRSTRPPPTTNPSTNPNNPERSPRPGGTPTAAAAAGAAAAGSGSESQDEVDTWRRQMAAQVSRNIARSVSSRVKYGPSARGDNLTPRDESAGRGGGILGQQGGFVVLPSPVVETPKPAAPQPAPHSKPASGHKPAAKPAALW